MNDSVDRRENRLSAYISSLIVNAILLWVMNKLPSWNIPYLLDSYARALPAINLSLSVQIAMNTVLIFYHPRFFHHLAQVIVVGFSIFAISTFVTVFPVDLSSIPFPAAAPSLNFIVRLALYVAIGGAAIGGIVHAVKFLVHLFRGELEQ